MGGFPGQNRSHFTLRQPIFHLPGKDKFIELLDQESQVALLAEADDLLQGQIKIFGGEQVPFRLKPSEAQAHWTVYEGRISDYVEQDIKYVWEIGRFGWAFTLARAYYISQQEEYVKAFWSYTREFIEKNPPYYGLQWVSAQEVALRIIGFVFAYQVFANSEFTRPEDKDLLGWAIGVHAERILPTFSYARSQNNNHLLSEAAGLFTAGLVLPDHPSAHKWRKMGWNIFNDGLQHQISPDGSYIQHSSNYHRLMLQLALWVNLLASHVNEVFPDQTCALLSAATNWLFSLIDPISGGAPNLGPNDGAYILPLTSGHFNDYKPVIKAAQIAFQGEAMLPFADKEEMVQWLASGSLPKPEENTHQPFKKTSSPILKLSYPNILKPDNTDTWAYLRAAHFTSRPGHADQLHLDLWWHGLNVALDAGTYLYNAPPPWDNALKHTQIHNTVTVDGQQQMTNAGRFLYLDWAQAEMINTAQREKTKPSITAQHHGYKHLGLTHQRSVSMEAKDHWVVVDQLISSDPKHLSSSSGYHRARLHWLLPDWPWVLDNPGDQSMCLLKIKSPDGWIEIMITTKNILGGNQSRIPLNPSIIRAGCLLHGEAENSPTRGWFSPTYGRKDPAISFAIEIEEMLPLEFTTNWLFPAKEL